MERIYIVTDRKLAGDRFFEIIKNLVREGYRFIQLRENDLSAQKLSIMIEKILDITGGQIKLVINDRADLAKIYQLYGVQLKEISPKPELIKKIFGELMVGVSCHNTERATENQKWADFFVYGNVFETECKAGLPGRGIDGLKDILKATEKPVYAIGGINSDNAMLVKQSGGYGVALRSLVFGNKDYLKELEKIRNIWS